MSIDQQFREELQKIKRTDWALEALFDPAAIEKLIAARQGIQRAKRVIAYVVFENPFAQGGGIVAVAKYLPQYLAEDNGDVVLLSPYHTRLKSAPENREPPETAPAIIGSTRVTFDDRDVDITLREFHRDGVRWILFQADGFFEAGGGPKGLNPYNYLPPEAGDIASDEVSNSGLVRDALFAAMAVPEVLSTLGLTENIIVHAQDWQLSGTALTVKEALLDGRLKSAAVVVTSHNPYDKALGEQDLAMITKRVREDQWLSLRGDGEPRGTFYERMLPLVDAPISTVSRTFAHELVSDPLQTVHFANHLQIIFQLHGLIGVDNGLFGRSDKGKEFSDDAVANAKKGDSTLILEEKLTIKRTPMLRLLADLTPTNPASVQGIQDLADDIPVFMMFGRLDPGQKGFDLLVRAIERIEPGAARFVIAAMVPAGVAEFVSDMVDLADDRPGDVVLFTDPMANGYLETIAGASYCIMPSMYEPFGAATEPYLQGSPVVARATGGLLQQVVDFNDDAENATGILARTSFEATPQELGAHWQTIQTTRSPLRRMKDPFYAAMVEGLVDAIEQAIFVYRNLPGSYGRMLSNLAAKSTEFNWNRTAQEYGAIYDIACQ